MILELSEWRKKLWKEKHLHWRNCWCWRTVIGIVKEPEMLELVQCHASNILGEKKKSGRHLCFETSSYTWISTSACGMRVMWSAFISGPVQPSHTNLVCDADIEHTLNLRVTGHSRLSSFITSWMICTSLLTSKQYNISYKIRLNRVNVLRFFQESNSFICFHSEIMQHYILWCNRAQGNLCLKGFQLWSLVETTDLYWP